jgi:hypothetical protein
VFNTIADAFQKKRPYKRVTPFLAGLVSRWEAIKSSFTGKAPLITKETAATALAKVNFNNNKFLQKFPSYVFTPLANTISLTCEALQQKLNR